MGPVLVIVHRVIAGWLADQAGVPRDTAQCGAVTLIQRFGSALNLNVHFHMLWLDGVYDANVEPPRRKPRLRRARAPTSAQLTQLANTIAHRVCRHLSRRGWLEGEDESVFLSDSAAGDDGMDALRMSSIRSSTGSHRLRTRQHLRPFLGGHHTQGTVLPTQRATAELPLALGQQESAILPDATRGLLRRKASPQNTVSVAGRRPRDREHQPVVTNENRSFSMGCQQLSEIIRRRDTVYRCRIIGYTCRCRDSGQAPFDQRIGHAEHWRSRAIGRGVACATRSPTGGYRFYAADMFTTIAVNP
ncbi:hypothetical protein N791_07705 [Lysobacter defluvii IMMIB APB-9 = DSM 18482]|uniref:Transposase IS801/IS1294 domain-containing protein n=1 Tax=Lysobacter defluvii IMMIB APB-9 = DSM 18482 TaxID=1385515 RepID=A0A0A0M9I3_9GAMM|nr:hypothetical protein N791_07705 [Lysobacter defluvii IMMIB APB-9 = DSM 18482]